MIAKDRICRTKDGDICACDDPAAAFVVATAGHEVPKEYAAKVKAFLGDQPDDELAPVEPAEEKAAPVAANKAAKKAANK